MDDKSLQRNLIHIEKSQAYRALLLYPTIVLIEINQEYQYQVQLNTLIID